MEGKHIVITGGSSGIGAAAARQMHEAGARLTIVGRSPERTAQVAQEVGGTALICDFESLDSVRELADILNNRPEPVDVLINNTGMISTVDRRETADGHEATFQTNYLALYLLTRLLHDKLADGGGAVVSTASVGNRIARGPFGLRMDDLENERHYGAWKSYLISKLENVMFTRELARRWQPDGITATAFHPGEIASQFGHGNNGFIHFLYHGPGFMQRSMQTPEQGAETMVWLPDADAADEWQSGGYYSKRQPAPVNPLADNPRACAELWDRTARLLELGPLSD